MSKNNNFEILGWLFQNHNFLNYGNNLEILRHNESTNKKIMRWLL